MVNNEIIRKRIRASVQTMTAFHGVVSGLAVSNAILRLEGETGLLLYPHVAWITALIITIVPFHHGALRHMDDIYVHPDPDVPGPAKGAPLIDFGLLLLEACLLFWLSNLLNRQTLDALIPSETGTAQPLQPFVWWYLALLCTDILWAVLAVRFLTTDWQKVRAWAAINGGAAVLIWIFWWSDVFGAANVRVFAVWMVVVGRTAVDYWLNWPMYFPQTSRAPSSSRDYLSHEHYMRRALQLAKDSYEGGGCPIGAVLVANDNGAVLGEGHNNLVQEKNPIVHGEMAALRDARRTRKRGEATMYTTLQPCFMCAGAIVQFGIPRVVIGDTVNASSDETIRFMREHRVEVIVLDSSCSEAARECIELAKRFKDERPDLWAEDWGQLTQTGPITRTV